MKCKKCNKEAIIRIGNDYYCNNCFNKLYREDNIELPLILSIKCKKYEINYINLITNIMFTATSRNGYEIEMGFDPEMDIEECLDEFIEYVEDVVSNPLLKDNSLKEYGTIRINYEGFQIDNKVLTPDEFHKLLLSYEGWNLDYCINDSSYGLMRKNEGLARIKLTYDSLLDEYKYMMDLIATNKFISYENEKLFLYIFRNFMDKLKAFYYIEIRECSKLIDYIINNLREYKNECDSDILRNIIDELKKTFFSYQLFI